VSQTGAILHDIITNYFLMKNLLVYYLSITIPLLVIFLLLKFQYINSMTFAILMVLWALIYRPITDGIRLIEKGIIQKNEIWKLFIPFWRNNWFRELYFKK